MAMIIPMYFLKSIQIHCFSLTTFILFLFFPLSSQAQLIEGIVTGSNNTTLPYANITIKKSNRGTITNEEGTYSLNIRGVKETDSISFQFIGFKTKNISLKELIQSPNIVLTPDVMTITEVIIRTKEMSAEEIVKLILKNKNRNYNTNFKKTQIFSREKYTTDVNNIALEFKKSNIKELNKETLQNLQKNTPKTSTSYFDFLANFYFGYKKSSFKIEPIQAVELISKDLAELANYEVLFDTLFTQKSTKEYWKIKSGMFGEKITYPKGTTKAQKNTNTRPLSYYKNQIKKKANFANLDDEKLWEFLHKTGRYHYTLEGSTSILNENVYIISFTPKRKGIFEGKMYVSSENFALLMAHYQYSIGKQGKNFNLLGVGYTENGFKGSIYFQKENKNYELKHMSFKKDYNVRINRNIALQKKKNRFLVDKTLKELKINLKLNLQISESIEYFSDISEEITETTFNKFNEKEIFEIINVEQFNKKLWKEYNIIEPTLKIKEYKKLQ